MRVSIRSGTVLPKRLYLFNAPALDDAASGFGRERIIRALASVEALAKMDMESNQRRFTKRYRIPGGGTGRFYVIDPDKLDGSGGTT